MTVFKQVKEFHEKFGLPTEEKPTIPDVKRLQLRLSLILEEAAEVVDAMAGGTENSRWLGKCETFINRARDMLANTTSSDFAFMNLTHVAKELADLAYVVNGTGVEMGLDLDAVGDAVHISNLSKLNDEGKPIYNEAGKVLKGPNYHEPDIESVLERENEFFEVQD